MKQVLMSTLAKQIRGVSYKPTDLHDALDGESVILLRANNIENGLINFDDVVYVDKSKVSSEQYLQKGDILICASSGSKNLVGKAAQIQFDGEYTFGAFCKVVRPTQISPDYLGMYFQSPDYRRIISNLAQGANINNIKNEHIDTLVVNTYDEITQHRITNVLGKAVSVIHSRQQQLAELDNLIKARFVEMFGECLITTKLKELCIDYGRGKSPKYVDESSVRVINQACIYWDGIRFEKVKFQDDSNISKLRFLQNGDVLLNSTGTGTLGRCCVFVSNDAGNYMADSHVTVIRLILEKVNPVYLKSFFEQDKIQRDIYAYCVNGSTNQIELSREKLGIFDIVLPDIELQNQFATFVAQVDKSKVAVQKALDEAQTLFDSLMQQYFG